MANTFNLCPNCGSKNIVSKPIKWQCPDCGFDLYNNVASAVGIIIYDDDCNVLFETRAKEPRLGFLAIPGGFVNPDETAENAVVRECMEEIGYKVSASDINFLCTFPNTYQYKEIVYKTCDLFFTVKIKDKKIPQLLSEMKAEKSEVSSISIHHVATAKDVDSLPIAFESSVLALKKFIENL